MRSHLLLRRRPYTPPPCAGGPQQPLDDGKVVQKVPPGEQRQQQQRQQQQRQQQQQQATSSPFAEIERIRRVKKVGIGLSAAAVAGSAALLVHPPPVERLLPGVEAAAAASAALAAAFGLALAAAKLLLGDRLHVEAEGVRLFVEVVPDFVAPLPSSSSSGPSSTSASLRPDGRPFLVVRDAGDGRGLGVYVAERRRTGAEAEEKERGPPTPSFLPRGAFLGCYEGDLLGERAFWERYPRGVGDYCIGCGGGFCLDGGPLAKRLREEQEEEGKESSGGGGKGSGGVRYSPCLINHSSRRANVSRITRRAERKVELYASRNLLPGEELLLDYGRKYWQGREAEEMD